MIRLLTFVSFFLGAVLSSKSQSNLDQYKYFVIPSHFNSFDAPDKYQLNSLTHFLFKKNEFNVLKENDSKPKDLKDNTCLGLLVKLVTHKGGIFKTKVSFDFIDCNNQVVFKSEIGESREKDFKEAYHEALRNAFSCVTNEDYSFSVKLNEERRQLVYSNSNNLAINEVYYAQKIPNGYQLVDLKPSVFCKIIETETKDVYLVEGQSAMIYKENDNWYYSYLNTNGQTEKRKITIKF